MHDEDDGPVCGEDLPQGYHNTLSSCAVGFKTGLVEHAFDYFSCL